MFKQKVYDRCAEALKNKVSQLQAMLKDLIASTQNETKSSAGDKYETGRAMLQIEQDNIRKQLKEALEQKAAFEQMNIGYSSEKIVSGSLVKTDRAYLFISVALGKMQVDGITIIALSPQSPLGSKLIGLKTSESLTMNGTKYLIESIELLQQLRKIIKRLIRPFGNKQIGHPCRYATSRIHL